MLNAARMLSNCYDMESNVFASHGVNATLRIPFTYSRLDGREITLDIGTAIHVDESKGIASHGNDHFEVEPSDYIVSFLN